MAPVYPVRFLSSHRELSPKHAVQQRAQNTSLYLASQEAPRKIYTQLLWWGLALPSVEAGLRQPSFGIPLLPRVPTWHGIPVIHMHRSYVRLGISVADPVNMLR